LGRLLARIEEQLDRSAVADRAALFRLAAESCRAGLVRWAEAPVVLLDVPIDSRAERDLVGALIARSPDVLATIPDGDHAARDALLGLGGTIEAIDEVRSTSEVPNDDLVTLRQYIFTVEQPPARTPTGAVRLFSAPGEGREALEIVRRVLDEAARGV